MLSSAKCRVRSKHVPSMNRPHRLQPCALHRCMLVQRLLSVRARTAMPTSMDSEASEESLQDIMTTDIPDSDVLQVPDIRGQLEGQDSPFCVNDNRGGGFVGMKDLVALQSLKFESMTSAGFRDKDAGVFVNMPSWVPRAGPHRTIYYDPPHVTAAIVTCGGLCPGLNDVVQNIVGTLLSYGVPEEQILGIRFGLGGFYSKTRKPVVMDRAFVDGIHLKGGTVLGTSRGGADIKKITHRIKLWGLDMVFVIGGNGGNAAANAIHEECRAQNLNTSVVGVPKSIDNDIQIIDRCFGFESAVDEAQRALLAAKVEARSALRGVGLVNLMGRSSGFIAMQASMASGVVDVCLIPEITFTMAKLTEHIEVILQRKGHCVVCVAEGAGQDMMARNPQTDASGNPILGDIGLWLADNLKGHFKKERKPIDLKYIDPTYMVRAIPTIPNDRVYCKVLGQNSVHAAFAGFTGITTGMINSHYALLPIPAVISDTRAVNIAGRKWNRLISSIYQPDLSGGEAVTA